MILLILCITIVLFLIFSWINMIKHKQGYNVLGPIPLPVIGNAHLFVVNSAEFLILLQKLATKYGDAYLVYFLSSPYVILSHPKYIEPLVSSAELITKGRSYDFLRSWLGFGLLTASGQRWRTHRKFLTPAFHFNILQNFLPVFCRNGRILMDRLDELADGRDISLFPIIALAALDNVTEAIMGLSVESQKNSNSDYVKSIQTLSQITSLRMRVPFLREDFIFNLIPYNKQQDAALNVVHAHSTGVIEARRQELRNLNMTSLSASNELGMKNKHAFLDLLLLAEVDGQRIDEESVREEVDTFMFEGHDTTTSGIVYSLYCLAKYPEIQEKIFQEQKAILGTDFQRDPTFTELNKMKYLEMAIKESLRLYPAVPLIERFITKDVDVGELKLRKGTSVTINIIQMQRNPDVYDNPLEFRPERFETNEAKNAFNYLVFSAGPRNCIGQKFAMMEMKVTIAQIIKQFRLESTNQEVDLCADLVLRSSKGVHIKLTRR